MKRHYTPSEPASPEQMAARARSRRRSWRNLFVLLILGALVYVFLGGSGSAEVSIIEPIRPISLQASGSRTVSVGTSDGTRAAVRLERQGRPELLASGQSFFDDLVVEDGQTITGDVNVVSGDVRVKSGGRIEGSVVAYAGDVQIDDGGFVLGDITAWSGDVDVAGRVEGNVSALAGDLQLDESAWVGGDVSTLAGDIDREDAAVVGGTVLRGGSIDIPFAGQPSGVGTAVSAAPAAPEAPGAPEAPAAPVEPARRWGFNPISSFFGLVARLFVAIFFSVMALLLAMAVYSTRPALIDQVQDEMRLNMARSFAVGLVTNGALYILMRMLLWALCFAPLAVVPALALLALNAVGLTAMSRSLGQRFLPAVRGEFERKPVMEVALGALILFGALLVPAAVLGWGGFWTVLALVVASPGVGAIVEPWMTRYRNRKVQDLTSPGTAPTKRGPAPVAPVAPKAPAASVAPVAPAMPTPPTPAAAATPGKQIDLGAVTPPAEPASPIDLAAVQSDTPGAPAAAPVDLGAVERPVAAPSSSFDFSLPPQQQAAYQADPTLSVEDLVAAADAETAARTDAAARAEQAALGRVDTARGDDFTRIRGLGRAAERKLKHAGIYTFAELAALPAEIIARVLAVPVEEVIEDQITQQANLLVRGVSF